MKPIRIFLLLSSLLFIQQIIAQNLTISTGGETTPGTNWSITGNTLNVAASGSANIHPSVITNHLSSTGSLTITLPAQASVTRDIYINNSISYTGSNACTLTINAANELIVASGVSITSSTAAMNLVLRSIFSAGVPDYGRIQLNGTTINTNGGHFWAGGGSGNSTWNGLTVGNSYSRTWTDNVAGISFIGSTLNTNGGSIYMAGLSYNTSDGLGENYGVNIRNSAITSGTGQIDILGDLKGMYTTGSGLGIFGNSGAVTISSTTGAVNLTGTGADQSGTNSGWRRGALLYTLSSTGISVTSTSGNITITGTAAFPTNGNDDMIGLQLGSTQSITDGVKITSQTGNIKLTGSNTRENAGQNSNAVQFIAANVSNSIRIGSDGTNPYSGNITIEGNSIIQNNVNAGSGSISVQSTGPLTIQPLGNAFTYLRSSTSGTLTFDDDWNFGTTLSGLTFGKTTNTLDLNYARPLTVAGPITFHTGSFTINNNLTSSTASDITINATANFNTANTRQTISSAGGDIIIHADKDANGSGVLDLDYLTFNPGSGNTIIRGETFAFAIGVNGPFLNGTGNVTIEPSDASFGQTFQTAWFSFDQDNNSMGGLNLGKSGNTAQISIDGSNITAGGPVNFYGNNIVIGAAITASAHNIGLYANTAVTQTLPIIAAGLSLNGTGTFTLTNTSNNFTTLAGGAVGSLLGTTQIIDVSGGLTIGTVGSTTGLIGSNTIRVETLAGNLTLAESISTTSTSTDALILTSAKSTAIGVPSGGDIIVSGSPTITIGAGAIAKLYSGYDVTSTGLTALAGGASNARNNYDETTTTFNPTLSANNKYAIYRTAFGYGDLNIVSSGGDAEGTTWNYVNGVITTTSGTANVLNTDVQTKLNAANLSIEANKITFSASVTGTTSNTFNVLSKTHILNTNATTISTQGGNVLFASNVDDATDGESTTNGYINLRFGITINSNGGNITFGGGNTAGSDYSLGSSTEAYTEGIRFDIVIALNSGGGNIALRGKSYAMGVQFGYGAAGIGFYFFSAATGTINSGTGTITIDGFSQTSTSTYASGIYSMHNINITSANTTANAIRLMGKATGVNGDAVGIETESIFSVFATGEGGGITISSSQQIADFYDVIFRGETNILAKSGPIQLLGKQDGGVANGRWYIYNNFYLGSKALSAVPTSSSNITIQYDLYIFSGYNPKLATSGTLNWKPASASFGQNVGTDYFAWNQNSQTLSGLTIGKSGNTVIVYLNSAITVAGPINVYGATIEITGALTASGSDVSLYATTAVTQSQPIISSGLSLNGTGTFTLTNTSNNFTTLAGGAVGSLIGTTQIVDVSGGLTIGTVGSNTGLTGSSTIRVETLAGNISLAGSISTTSTSTDAVILTAAKNTAIGVGTGGDIILSGAPTITMGSGGIGKLFSGLESTSSGLTTLAGGSSNVRNNYDETTTTFSPVLSANNKHAIYRTSSGVGALTIVSSSGDAINTTWTYDNGVINTITTPVNILSSVIENYLASGPLTINAGNTTISSAITSTSSNALVLTANSTLSNTTPTTTVNAAITNGGPITINTGAFNIAQNITTTSTAVISISANNGFSTTTATSTRYTISTVGGNITINADNDANGTGLVDIDDLTLNPGTANLIIRGETFNFNTTQTRKPYINGTGSFTFESNDVAFGQEIISNWFVLDQDANGMSGLTLGKSGSTANVTLNSVFTVAGPINVYGGYVEVSSTITSSGNYDILLKGIADANSCVNISSGGITKSSGTGTLTMQGHGRVINSGTITTSGTGILNVVMWSDFDGDNVGGGTSQLGTISTNTGHVWLGGSNSNGGSYSWNGLAVGDGPSIGASGANSNALDIQGHITTSGGDLLVWAGNGFGGTNGIVTNAGWQLNVGIGDIVLITPSVLGTAGPSLYFRQSGGTFTMVPNGSSFPSTVDWSPSSETNSGMTGWNFPGDFNYLWIENPATLTNLSIGRYDGMTSGGVPVVITNTSNINFNLPTTIAGSMSFYGGALALSSNLTTTNATTGNILLSGATISGTGNIAIAAGRTATINVSSNSTYDGIVSGSGSGLTKLGAGMLTLTKDHTYSGPTVITAGDLQVGTGGSVSQASSGTIASTTSVSVASGTKLILAPNENIVFASPISGAGGVEIKGASGAYYNSFLTGTAATIAANSTVLEVLTRITGGLQAGLSVNGGGTQTAGAYVKSYSAATNTATLQFQQYDGTYTKCVFAKLSQSGTNVMVQANTAFYSGAAFRNGNSLGADMSTGSTLMGLASTSGGSGYGISQVYLSGKVNFTGNLTYTGNTLLSNTITNGATGNVYSYTSKGTQEITDASSSFPSTSTVVNNGLVIFNRATPLTISSDMEGTEEVLQVGAAITLTGANTHSGNTTIDLNKSLVIGSGATIGSITGNIVNYGTLTFNRSDSSSYTGIISGSGALVKSGADAFTLTGLNTYTGATTINGGRLILQRDVPATSSSSYSGAGKLVIQPNSNSFTSSVIYPIPGFTISSSIGGLTIGKPTNTASVSFTSSTTTAGTITAYGGAITVSAALSAAGDILLDGDNGSFLTQNTKGVEINAAVTTTNNGDITINGRGGNATAINTHGINVTNLVEAGGTGNIELIGYGGLSANGTGSSCHGVNIDGGSAWVKSNGGNVAITGYGGGAGVGTYSQGVPILTTARVSAGGTGTINITGTGGVNTAAGLRGVVITTNSSVYSAGGAISITGTNGTNGSDNSDGVTIDGSNVGSNTSGAITISGTAGGGTGSEAISLSNTNTLGGASHSNNVLLRGDKFAVSGTTSLLTTGQVTIEPYSDLFSSALTFPISSMTIANTITGLTLGKATNTANITFSNATNINGPITVYGGTVTLIENISSSASGTISLYANALTISSGKTITSGGQLIITPQSASTTIGIAGASGTLALPLTYFSTNFTDGFSNIQIGRNEHNAAISSNAFTLRDNMTFLTSGSLTLGGLPIMGSNNVTLGSEISSISGMPTYYFQTNGTGEVIRSLSNTSTLQFPIGNSSYNPVSIKNNSGSADDFSARVLDVIENNPNLSAATYVNRTWDIGKTTSNSSAGIDFTFNWNAGEIVNGTLVNPILNHYGTYWETATGTSTAAAGSPILSLTHTGYMGTFSPFAISDASTPLPVSMASFNLNCSLEDVELKWQTASEHNSDYFQLETSLDGINWEIVETIPAAGFSQEQLNYSVIDLDAARHQKYYRLKQVDFNGEFALYGPLKAECGAASTNIGLHPNPCESQLTLSIDTQIPTELSYTIANPEGVVLETKKMAVQSGITLYTLDVSNYPGGMYILQFDLNEKRYIKKLTVQ